jgi:hypothetical protein
MGDKMKKEMKEKELDKVWEAILELQQQVDKIRRQ